MVHESKKLQTSLYCHNLAHEILHNTYLNIHTTLTGNLKTISVQAGTSNRFSHLRAKRCTKEKKKTEGVARRPGWWQQHQDPGSRARARPCHSLTATSTAVVVSYPGTLDHAWSLLEQLLRHADRNSKDCVRINRSIKRFLTFPDRMLHKRKKEKNGRESHPDLIGGAAAPRPWFASTRETLTSANVTLFECYEYCCRCCCCIITWYTSGVRMISYVLQVPKKRWPEIRRRFGY